MTCTTDATFQITQGANKTLRVSVVDSDGVPFDLTGATGYLAVKQCNTATGFLIEKRTSVPAEGVIVGDPEDGVMEFYFVPADTSSLADGERLYDVWIETAAGSQYQVVPTSRFVVTRRVTVIP